MIARIVTVAALAAVAVLGVVVLSSGGDGYVVQAELADAAGLRKNSDVKIGGVPGGTVEEIELTRGDRALVTMKLDEEAAPIGRGAQAHARPVNLLGEKYVDLDAGNLRAPQASGARIGVARTGTSVELDDVLNTLTPDTRGALRILINEAGLAMAGTGTDFNALLDELPPALDRTQDLLAQIGAENRTMRRLIRQGDRVVGAVGARRGDLAGLVDTAQEALQETAQRREQLGNTVAAAPGALTQLRSTLLDLQRTAGDLQPASRGLRRAAAPLAPTLRALPGFADAAQPTLRTARATSGDLARLGREGTRPLRRLRPTADRLRDFSRDLEPLTRGLDEGTNLDGLLGLMNGWVKTIQTSDGLGHLFRLRGIADEEFATSVLQRYGILAPARKRRGAARAPEHPAAPAPADRPQPAPERPPARPALPALPALPEIRLPKLDLQPLPQNLQQLPEQLAQELGGMTKGTLERLGDALLPPRDRPQGGAPTGPGALLDYLLGN